MKGTGIFVTKEELERVQTAQKCSGMFLSGGTPMGNPEYEVFLLQKKYGLEDKQMAFNAQTGEFLDVS